MKRSNRSGRERFDREIKDIYTHIGKSIIDRFCIVFLYRWFIYRPNTWFAQHVVPQHPAEIHGQDTPDNWPRFEEVNQVEHVTPRWRGAAGDRWQTVRGTLAEVRPSKVCKGSGGWRSTDWQGWHFGGRDVRLPRSRPTSRRTTLWCMPRADCCMLFERKNIVVARAVCCCGFHCWKGVFALSVSRPDQMSTCIQFRNFLIKLIRDLFFPLSLDSACTCRGQSWTKSEAGW